MHSIKEIRAAVDDFRERLAARGFDYDIDALVTLDDRRREYVRVLGELQSLRRRLAALIGSDNGAAGSAVTERLVVFNRHLEKLGIAADQRPGVDSSAQEQALALKGLSKILQQASEELNRQVQDELAGIPNLVDPDLPSDKFLVSKSWGEARREASLKRHFDLMPESLGLTVAAKMAGSKFSLLRGGLARLERALQNMMVDQQLANGFQLVSPPLLLKKETMFNSGHLPKFAQEQFVTGDDNWLLPTAEVALVNLWAGAVLAEEKLPLRYVAMTPCFRREAGAAGKDTRGIIRQHQFYKVELVTLCTAEQAEQELAYIVTCAEQILVKLGLPYRVIVLPANDTGFAACKTYDLEVFMAGEGVYREVSSCSNCGNFQARRANIQSKNSTGKRRLVYTLNGSGLAVGRTLAALLEHYQRPDGSVAVPEALRPYMGGVNQLDDGTR